MRGGGRRPRPKGRCGLCGKYVYGRAVRFDNGVRHADCIPGKGGHRYGVADRRNEGSTG